MSALSDPTYLRLYREYAEAIRSFEIERERRRKVRDRVAVMNSPVLRVLREASRRPVGTPFQLHSAAPEGRPLARPPAPGKRATSRGIYLGPILGWARIIYTDPVASSAEHDFEEELGRVHDSISFETYWNAKSRYLACRQAFFAHVRRGNIDLHRVNAIEALGEGVNLQLLGLAEEDEPEFMKRAKREVEAACRNAWAIYMSGPTPPTPENKLLLLSWTAEAQMVGLQSDVTTKMEEEVHHLADNGELELSSRPASSPAR